MTRLLEALELAHLLEALELPHLLEALHLHLLEALHLLELALWPSDVGKQASPQRTLCICMPIGIAPAATYPAGNGTAPTGGSENMQRITYRSLELGKQQDLRPWGGTQQEDILLEEDTPVGEGTLAAGDTLAGVGSLEEGTLAAEGSRQEGIQVAGDNLAGDSQVVEGNLEGGTPAAADTLEEDNREDNLAACFDKGFTAHCKFVIIKDPSPPHVSTLQLRVLVLL
jgi:hypothetical protein